MARTDFLEHGWYDHTGGREYQRFHNGMNKKYEHKFNPGNNFEIFISKRVLKNWKNSNTLSFDTCAEGIMKEYTVEGKSHFNGWDWEHEATPVTNTYIVRVSPNGSYEVIERLDDATDELYLHNVEIIKKQNNGKIEIQAPFSWDTDKLTHQTDLYRNRTPILTQLDLLIGISDDNTRHA